MAVSTQVREELLLIDGERRAPAGRRWLDDVNPATGSVFARIAQADESDAVAAIESAHAAFARWSAMYPADREGVLLKAAQLLEERREAFVAVMIDESGAAYYKAQDEVNRTLSLMRAAAGDSRRVYGWTAPAEADKWSLTFRHPLGVVAAITPWNFPLYLSMKKVALALAVGNAVVLKPSSDAPVTGYQIGQLFLDAGLPPGALNVITGPGATVGDVMVTHPLTALVSLTGETVTGKRVAARAAEHFKRFSLELGGKNPVLVLKDADLDYAAQAIAFGAFNHQGQNCMAVDRVIVEAPVYDGIVERLAARAAKVRAGDPWVKENHLGPMIHNRQLEHVHRLVTEAVRAGARLAAGGEPNPPYYPATVVADVTPAMSLFQEETFGPVAPVIRARDADEALSLANQSRYGLSAGIFTNDLQLALRLASRIESGMVHVNEGSVYSEPQSPFGGVKESGAGREGSGGCSIEEMTERKWVTLQLGQRRFPW